MSTPKPFAMIERALRELIETLMPDADGKVGGSLSYDGTTDFYVWLGLVTGSATEVDGDWVVDIDVFDTAYGRAMDRSLALEALLIRRGGHRTSLMRIDTITQNEAPIERPWNDDTVFRVGATYALTARRSG